MQKFKTRIAPTPSGYLHIGNCISFLITWAIAKSNNGDFFLRIDDIDKARTRIEYIEDIFSTIDFLDIDYHHGPFGVDDFFKNFSQHNKLDRYNDAIKHLAKNELLYSCVCSRKEILQNFSEGIYQCPCKNNADINSNLEFAIKIKVDGGYQSKWREFNNREKSVNLSKTMKDFVVMGKNGLPSYQLVSVCDDIDMGINFIVRGEDLINSTASQIFLSHHLDKNNFSQATFYHHALVTDSKGEKMSKSKKSVSIKHLRDSGLTREQFFKDVSSKMNFKEIATNLDEFYLLVKDSLFATQSR